MTRSSPDHSVTGVRRRFLVLTGLRWLPVGLMVPVLVLLPLDRGLSLSEVGVAVSLQGIVVMLLELPTGGLADTVGRRRVLLLAGVVGVVSMTMMFLADDLAGFAAAYALQGVYRALDSGPLEAWYVDASLAVDPAAAIEKGLGGAGVTLGVAISAGALASGGLIALGDLGPVTALSVPLLASLLLQLVALVAVALLMSEHRPAEAEHRPAEAEHRPTEAEPQPTQPQPTRPRTGALRAALATPRTIARGVRLLRHSPVLLAIVAVELFWGFSATTYEALLPVRLAEIVSDTEAAGAITGPAASAAWLASAVGAAAMPWLGRRIGIAPAAAVFRVAQGVTVALMGLLGGVVGVLVAYFACYAVHGASNPAHMTLLHRQVDGSVRATAVSMNSMVAQPAGALGTIVLTGLADRFTVSVAMYVGAVVLALAAPLYLPAWRQERAGADAVSSAREASARA